MTNQQIYDEAMAAGRKAAEALTPVPMAVGYESRSGYKVDVVPDGVCGFAWVKVRPATSAFAKFLKTKGHSKAYTGGIDIWIGDYNQSMQKKEAHAHAMAQVLNDYGITAYAQSRMD